MKKKRIVLLLASLTFLLTFAYSLNIKAAYTKTNGYYQTNLCKKAWPIYGPDGDIEGYSKCIKKAVLKKNSLTTYGNFYYAKNQNILFSYFGIKNIKAKKRHFVLSSKCKFYTGGGGSPSTLSQLRVKRISKATASTYLKKYNNKDVIIRVKKGKVIEIIFASLCYA